MHSLPYGRLFSVNAACRIVGLHLFFGCVDFDGLLFFSACGFFICGFVRSVFGLTLFLLFM